MSCSYAINDGSVQCGVGWRRRERQRGVIGRVHYEGSVEHQEFYSVKNDNDATRG